VRQSAEILHGIVSYNCLFTHQNSSISEMVRWEDFHILVDLAWNDPHASDAVRQLVDLAKVLYTVFHKKGPLFVFFIIHSNDEQFA